MPSTAIRSFSYDEPRRELSVTFTSGRAYVYSEVPPVVAADLKAAFSRGTFVNRHIRDRYPCREVLAEKAPLPLLDALKRSQ